MINLIFYRWVLTPWGLLMRADDVLAAEKKRTTAEDLHGQTLLLSSRKLVRSQLDTWFSEAMEEENIFSANNLITMRHCLCNKGLALRSASNIFFLFTIRAAFVISACIPIWFPYL